MEVFVYEMGTYKTGTYKKGTDLIFFGSKYKVEQVIGEDVNDNTNWSIEAENFF